MKIDVYGSRSFLVNLLKLKLKLKFEFNDVFTGTTIDSQMKKELAVDEERMKNFISNHEILEIKTDFLKRFRKSSEFAKSKIIFIDFMHEGKLLIRFGDGTVTKRPVLNRYGYKWKDGIDLSYEDKLSKIEEYVGTFIDYLKAYDLVIVNKARTSKYERDQKNNLSLKDNIQEVNFLNFYAETFEEILSKKREDIYFIPEYDSIHQLEEGYLNTNNYNEFLLENIASIINENKIYI